MKVDLFGFKCWIVPVVLQTNSDIVREHGNTILGQKMKFSIKDFFSKCDQVRRKLRIWSHLPKKSLVENFIFCAVILGLSCEMKAYKE